MGFTSLASPEVCALLKATRNHMQKISVELIMWPQGCMDPYKLKIKTFGTTDNQAAGSLQQDLQIKIPGEGGDIPLPEESQPH